MNDGLLALFWGVITFSLIVVIHEGGHFLTARMFGVKVHEFMVGLPGPAIRFRGKKTTYGVTAIPLGGYVRIAGMDPGPEDPRLAEVLASLTRVGTANAIEVSTVTGFDSGDADRMLITLADWDALVQSPDDEYTYVSRFTPEEASDPTALLDKARSVTYRALPTWKRVVVLSAGVVLNLVTAIAVFTFVLSVFGYLQETTFVGGVNPGSGAQAAGIRADDRLVSFDGVPIGEWADLTREVTVREAGDVVLVTVERNGKLLDLTATLGARPEGPGALLGVQTRVEQVHPNVAEALVQSVSYIGLTFKAIAGFFNPSTFQQSISQSSSVIGASYIAAEAARTGPLDYAAIVAVLSLSLGVINILPIPPLDGGKVAIEIVEKLRGKPLSRNLSLGLSASGAVLLFALIGYLMYADVVRFIAS